MIRDYEIIDSENGIIRETKDIPLERYPLFTSTFISLENEIIKNLNEIIKELLNDTRNSTKNGEQ